MARNYSSTATTTTLAAPINDTQTSMIVGATTGFPAAPFALTVDTGAVGQEAVLVTGVAGATLTITRGYDSTSAQSHLAGAVVTHSHLAIDFRESAAHQGASTGVHGVTGAVVGTTDAQTLTNKTLGSTNTLNGFTASKNVVTDATGKLVAGTSAVPTGTLVGTSDTQTLTNKDLSSGTNVFPGTLATDAEVTSAVSTHAALTATHGATGAVVGTTNTQTLTNKTLDSPVITGVGLKGFALKTLDESVTSSTVLQGDNELTLAIPAPGTYIFDAWLFGQSAANAAGDINIGFSFPTGTLHYGMQAADHLITSGNIEPGQWGANLSATSGTTFTTVGLSTSTLTIHARGVLIATAAGSLQLVWSQAVSSASASTVKAGSHMALERVA